MLLEMAADGFGDRVALGPSDGGLTYRDLYDSAGAASVRFRADGGSHVAMADLSSAALPVSLFGAAWAGLPFVPLNYRLTDDELAALASRISPAIIIVDPDSPDRLTGIDGIGLLSRRALMDLVDGADPPEPEWVLTGEGTAIALFPRGATGDRNAAVLRHRHLV